LQRPPEETVTIATVTALYQGDPDLRDRIRTRLEADKRLSQAVLAKESGVSSSVINQWLSGKYPGDNEAVDTKLRLWETADEARRAAGSIMPLAPGFQPLPTSTRILAALAYAQMAGDIAVLYGGAGLGKTTACQHYQTVSPNVWLVTMDESTAGLVTSLQEISDTLGLSSQGGAREMAKRICRRVRGTNGLLLIDEAQHLGVPALEQIRAVHDATGIAVALVGNEGVFSRMAGGRGAERLDRLFSRVGKRLPLRQSSEADILGLIRAWGITDTKCHGVLTEVARRPGALRGLTKVLRLAAMNATAEERPVCCDDVRAAAAELGGVA
jgi:DNA transposition AAA+ family ATPase